MNTIIPASNPPQDINFGNFTTFKQSQLNFLFNKGVIDFTTLARIKNAENYPSLVEQTITVMFWVKDRVYPGQPNQAKTFINNNTVHGLSQLIQTHTAQNALQKIGYTVDITDFEPKDRNVGHWFEEPPYGAETTESANEIQTPPEETTITAKQETDSINFQAATSFETQHATDITPKTNFTEQTVLATVPEAIPPEETLENSYTKPNPEMQEPLISTQTTNIDTQDPSLTEPTELEPVQVTEEIQLEEPTENVPGEEAIVLSNVPIDSLDIES